MMNMPGNPKAMGVRGNAGAVDNEQHPPQEIIDVVPMQMFGVQFTDEQGKQHISTVVRAGAALYWAPNAEVWTSQLKPAAAWFKAKFEVKAGKAGASEEVPKKDSVDVLGEEEPAK